MVESLKIILSFIAAAILYEIVHDQFTASYASGLFGGLALCVLEYWRRNGSDKLGGGQRGSK